MKNYICVFDFETDGVDPNTCSPVQLSSCILHPITLEVVPDSFFHSFICPPNIRDANYFKEHEDNILWHAKHKKVSPQDVLAEWKSAPPLKEVFDSFVQYLKRFSYSSSFFDAPIRAGINIRNFDNIILERLCRQFNFLTKKGEQNLFHPRDVIDILDLAFFWFESLPEPESYSLDSLRAFFGLDMQNIHDARKDVLDEAVIIQHFLRLMRRLAPKVKFKGAMNGHQLSMSS